MSQCAFTIKQIASGLGISVQAVDKRSRKEGWEFKEVPGRGGKRRMFQSGNLPEDVAMKMVLISSEPCEDKSPDTTSNSRAISLQKDQDITARQNRVAWARAGLCRAIDRLVTNTGMSVSAACNHLSVLLSSGKAPANWIELAIEANDRPRAGAMISVRSLLSYHQTMATYGEKGLIPGRRKKDLGIPTWAGMFLRYYQVPTKPSVDDAYRQFKAALNGTDAPSIHQVRRFLSKMSAETRESGRMGPRELRNIQPFIRRKFEQLMPNDVWTADGHTFDAEIAHPLYANKLFRPEITTFADVRTRRIVGWSVDLAESTISVLDAMRHSVKSNGIPALWYVDNGSGFDNEKVKGTAARIGIETTHSIPYRSQARGVIERIQKVWVRLAKRLPTYMGADMDKEAKTKVYKITRQALKAGLSNRAIISWDMFLELIEHAVAEYNGMQHSTLKDSPDQVWDQYVQDGWEAEHVDPEMLDALLRPQVSRTTNRAEVRLFNRRYFNEALRHHHGEEVMVGYDLRDASRIWVHDLSGRLICEAGVDANAVDYFPTSRIEEARAKREKAQLGRLVEKIENKTGQRVTSIQLEHLESRTLDAVLGQQSIPQASMEAIEASVRLVEEEPEIQWAMTETSRWNQYHDWSCRDDLTEEQERWVRIYPTTDEYAGLKAFYEDPSWGGKKETAC